MTEDHGRPVKRGGHGRGKKVYQLYQRKRSSKCQVKSVRNGKGEKLFVCSKFGAEDRRQNNWQRKKKKRKKKMEQPTGYEKAS